MTPIDEMTIEQIQAELRAGNVAEAVEIEAYRERRARLWRRLDLLTKSGEEISP